MFYQNLYNFSSRKTKSIRRRKLVQFLNTGVFIFEKAFEPKSTYSTKPETEDYDPNSRFKRRFATILCFSYWLEACGA
jgi:hypothetical protein